MSTHCGGWIYIYCLSLVCGFGQLSGRAGQSELPALSPIVSSKRQITLDVVVTDKAGKQVPHLQQQDFTLLDNKQPQEILSFRAVEGGDAAADLPVEVVLLVDEVNSSVKQVALAREAVEKFLRRNGGVLPRPVSMVFFTGLGTTMERTSSQDGSAIIAYLNQKKPQVRTLENPAGWYAANDRVLLSLRTMEQLAGYEATKPGRKLVVWISPGWLLLSGPNIVMTSKTEQWIINSAVALSDRLRRARITLYAVDPLGMEDTAGFWTDYYKEFLKGVREGGVVQLGNLALQVLAYQSGGLVLNSNNDVSGEVGACVADANAFYVLSFNGLPGDGPNDYHALELKIDKPGLKARTRAGYYAQPER